MTTSARGVCCTSQTTSVIATRSAGHRFSRRILLWLRLTSLSVRRYVVVEVGVDGTLSITSTHWFWGQAKASAVLYNENARNHHCYDGIIYEAGVLMYRSESRKGPGQPFESDEEFVNPSDWKKIKRVYDYLNKGDGFDHYRLVKVERTEGAA